MITDPLLFHRVARKLTDRLRGRSPGNSLLVTSARPGEGKTFFARALASTLAQQGIASVVVDCSGSGAAVRTDCGTTWSDLLAGGSPFADTLRAADAGQAAFIAYGDGRAVDLFRADTVARSVALLSSRFGFVVLDGPVLANCGVLSACADGSVLVIDAERTRREIVKGSLQSNPIDPQKLLGAVLNRKPYYVPAWLYRRAL